MSLEQTKKFAESKQSLEENKRKKMDDAMKKLEEDKAEREMRQMLQDKEVKKIMKANPLYKQRE